MFVGSDAGYSLRVSTDTVSLGYHCLEYQNDGLNINLVDNASWTSTG